MRTYELAPPPLPGSSHLRSVEDIMSSLSEHEKKKSERRALQMKTAREKARRKREEKAVESDPDGREIAGELGEMLRAEMDGGAEGQAEGQGRKRKVDERSSAGDAGAGGSKRPRGDEPSTVEQADSATTAPVESDNGQERTSLIPDSLNSDTSAIESNNQPEIPPAKSSEYPIPPSTISSQLLLRLQPEMRGHTSYLTFATYHPSHIHRQLAEQGAKSGFQTTPRTGTPEVSGAAADVPAVPAVVAEQTPSVVVTERTETEYGDQAMEEVMGTLTEEEMIAMMS